MQKNACLEVMFFFVYNQKTKELRNFEMSEKEMEHMNSIYKKLKTIKFEIIIVSIALFVLGLLLVIFPGRIKWRIMTPLFSSPSLSRR